jgi:LysR family carnitine catabolism transcriptional activator
MTAGTFTMSDPQPAPESLQSLLGADRLNVTLKQLNAFIKVANVQSFTQAASLLNVSQSALTMQIMTLEDQLGLQLFDRRHRQIALTFTGANLLPLAETIVRNVERFASLAGDLAGLTRGVVRVAALPSIAADHVARAAGLLRQEYPGFVIQIRDAVAQTVIELVKKGEVDFGISSPEITDAELIFDPLLTDRLCAFEHEALASQPPRTSIRLEELSRKPLILSGKNGIVRRLFDRALAERGLSVAPAFEAVYDTTAIALAREGAGTAILSDTIGKAVNLSGLRMYPIEDPVIERQISFVQARKLPPSEIANAFKTILRDLVVVRSTAQRGATSPD